MLTTSRHGLTPTAAITKILREKKADFTAVALFRVLNEVYAIPVRARYDGMGPQCHARRSGQGVQFLGVRMPDRVLRIEKSGIPPYNRKAWPSRQERSAEISGF